MEEYDANRGCGTVVDSQTGQHLTVYANYVNLQDGEVLRKGQEVEYEIDHSRHWAVNVGILKEL